MKILKAQTRWRTNERINTTGTFYTTTEQANKQNIVEQLLSEQYNDCFITMGSEDFLYGEYVLQTELHVDNYAPKFYEPADVIQRIELLHQQGKISDTVAKFLLGGN